MAITDIIHQVRNDSIADLICLDTIKTEADKEKYNRNGYLIGYTADEFKKSFPALDTSKIYFCNGFDKTFYYDKEKFILFNTFLYDKQYMYPAGSGNLEEDVVNMVGSFDKISNAMIYRRIMFNLNDRMRMEYLNLLLDNNKTADLYEVFMDYYKMTDFGCGSVKHDNMRKLVLQKSKAEKEETAELTKDLPDEVILYRGEGDKSTPTE